MYNRERQIRRAIDSCLNQNFENYELIVIDDGSIDKSVDVVRSYTDNRIRLICHPANRGVCPARNTGISIAKGEWMVFLDSDDELVPEGLSTIYKRSSEVGDEVSRLQFMGKLDSGYTSPDPPLEKEFWDYLGYIKWMEKCYGRRQDSLPIIKRSTFMHIRFADDRTYELPYHLNFMKMFNAMSFPDVVALYHQDAGNQLTRPDIKRILGDAKDQATSGRSLLYEHGDALKYYAPQVYSLHISGLATSYFLIGDRLNGIKYSVLSLSSNTSTVKSLAILILGIIGPKPLVWFKHLRITLLTH
jgi:glycosyltransferase involved in cell wall biosynthesis